MGYGVKSAGLDKVKVKEKNSREVLVVQNFQEALELLVGPVERKGHDSQGWEDKDVEDIHT